MTCEYRTPSISTNWALAPDVAMAALVRCRARSRIDALAAGGASIVQPSRPGGASPTTMSPPASRSARLTPWERSVRSASCRM
jgi:hypothetical protein